MNTIEKILSHQLEHDVFHNLDDKVKGIAQRAVDQGYNSLTPKQKAVINPQLTKHCSGYTAPGGDNNECHRELSGEQLLNAYEQCDDTESLQCESCLDLAAREKYIWDRDYRDK